MRGRLHWHRGVVLTVDPHQGGSGIHQCLGSLRGEVEVVGEPWVSTKCRSIQLTRPGNQVHSGKPG